MNKKIKIQAFMLLNILNTSLSSTAHTYATPDTNRTTQISTQQIMNDLRNFTDSRTPHADLANNPFVKQLQWFATENPLQINKISDLFPYSETIPYLRHFISAENPKQSLTNLTNLVLASTEERNNLTPTQLEKYAIPPAWGKHLKHNLWAISTLKKELLALAHRAAHKLQNNPSSTEHKSASTSTAEPREFLSTQFLAQSAPFIHMLFPPQQSSKTQPTNRVSEKEQNQKSNIPPSSTQPISLQQMNTKTVSNQKSNTDLHISPPPSPSRNLNNTNTNSIASHKSNISENNAQQIPTKQQMDIHTLQDNAEKNEKNPNDLPSNTLPEGNNPGAINHSLGNSSVSSTSSINDQYCLSKETFNDIRKGTTSERKRFLEKNHKIIIKDFLNQKSNLVDTNNLNHNKSVWEAIDTLTNPQNFLSKAKEAVFKSKKQLNVELDGFRLTDNGMDLEILNLKLDQNAHTQKHVQEQDVDSKTSSRKSSINQEDNI